MARLTVAQPNKNAISLNLNFMRPGRLRRRHRRGAGFHIELGSMPGTFNRPVSHTKRPLAERPAVMRADVVQGVYMPGRTDQHHEPLADLDEQLARVGDLVQLAR